MTHSSYKLHIFIYFLKYFTHISIFSLLYFTYPKLIPPEGRFLKVLCYSFFFPYFLFFVLMLDLNYCRSSDRYAVVVREHRAELRLASVRCRCDLGSHGRWLGEHPSRNLQSCILNRPALRARGGEAAHPACRSRARGCDRVSSGDESSASRPHLARPLDLTRLRAGSSGLSRLGVRK